MSEENELSERADRISEALSLSIQRRASVANNRKLRAAGEIAELDRRLACAKAEHSAAAELEQEMNGLLQLIENLKGAE